jgi:hypothetical protein
MDDDIYGVKAKDLLTLLNADKDVIGGIMHTGGFPHAMCAFRRYDTSVAVADQPIQTGPARLYELPHDQRFGIQKVDLIPFAFTLIKMSVFSKIAKPWFECNAQAPTDSWFADKILTSGLEYYAHFGVWLNHRGITRDNQPLYVQMGIQEQQRQASNQIVYLTPEEMKMHEIVMTEKLRVAEEDIKKKAVESQAFFSKSPDEVLAKKVVNTPDVKPTV